MSATSTTIPTQNTYGYDWNLYIATQSFNVTDLYGNQTTVSFSEINSYEWGIIGQSAAYGFTVGFTSMLMIILLILTDRKKIMRPIFIFNFACLFFICVRSIVALGQNGTAYSYGIGESMLGSIWHYPKSAYIPAELTICTCNILLYAGIMFSLILQVRVVFAAEPRTQAIITAILGFGALTIEAFWITFEGYSLRYIFSITTASFPVPPFLYKAVEIGMITFIGICCLLFLWKLFVSIRRRRRLGFQGFGPLHILFIMFCQCLILPCCPYL